jgi:PQQ-dependent dehydrogenase (s-GDH family)
MLPTAKQIQSQNWTAYEGKVLRMNPDGSIPKDNPVINGVRSHIFSYGHRNPQGLTIGPNGHLYVSEHGDKSDDELNRLQAGGNYGWPYVAGYQDGKAFQFANWTAAKNCKELTWTNIPPFPPNVPLRNESQFKSTHFVPPVQTFYTVNSDYNFSKPAGCGYVCWPTIAPSGTHFYLGNAIPGWNGTILMTTLKSGQIFQLKLSENGTALATEPVKLFHSENRYRDLAFSPDGRTIYVITDSEGPIQAMDYGMNNASQLGTLKNPGTLLEFQYSGNTSASGE